MIDLLKSTPRGESEFIFTDAKGNPLKDVRRSFKTVLKKAAIKNFRFHDLRRSSATVLLKMGCPLTVIQKHLEHTSLEMAQRYLHMQDKMEREELEKLGGIFDGRMFTGQKMRRSELSEDTPVAGTAWNHWSGRPDLNWRPPAPKAGALPGCATPRHPSYNMKRRSVARITRNAKCGIRIAE
jgi:hypothetical protein